MDTTLDRLARLAPILEDYATGCEPLDTVAKRHGLNGSTVRRWAVQDAAVGEAYARARSVSAGSLEDAALTVANATTPESYQADRLRIDTYKWAAAKRHPKEYGDTVRQEHNVTVATLHLDALRQPRITAQATVTQQLTAGDDVPE